MLDRSQLNRTLATQIVQVRERLGLSRRQAARLADLSAATLRRIEVGEPVQLDGLRRAVLLAAVASAEAE